ncbi:MAG: methionine synthase, partial [Gammaproteobacteria bacterium]|nr:methionine synthase [Gammaproteobacteria bacterium]
KQDCAKRRERHGEKSRLAPQLGIQQARSNRAVPDWKEAAAAPSFIGTRVFDIPLEELVDFIDWMPFFNAWEFHGKFPAILEDDIVGEAASNLYRDARAMLDRIIDEKWLQSKAVVGLFPANAVEDDIVLFADEARSEELATLHQLRQQRQLPNGQPNLCLADFVAPRQSGIADHIGAFAVTAGIGIEKHVAEFEGKHDDYNAILLKALADRLAEASAEYMHAKVRKELWGYASDESLNNDALIAEGYRGIRPAPGYPACPDHMEKTTLWNLLDVEKNVGIELTDSFAMYPAASVSGWYLAHPEAKYFQVGKIGRDQAEDYARRKGISLATVERWLASNLGYDAAAA